MIIIWFEMEILTKSLTIKEVDAFSDAPKQYSLPIYIFQLTLPLSISQQYINLLYILY